jgi:hypothetical protein
MKDDRIKKNPNADQRGTRAEQDRSARGAASDELASQQERRRMFREEWIQEALPKPPDIPGYHLCWLSSTNSYDPIHKRTRMGYTAVHIDEVPGFENYRVKAGEQAGLVACNEMVLYKIPQDIYQQLMEELHHYAPQDEADKIRVQAEQQMGRDSNGKRLGQIEGEGINEIDKPMPIPVFQ